MAVEQGKRLQRLFARVIALRWLVLAGCVLLVPAVKSLVLRIPSEGTIDRLVVASDPDYAATRAFQKVFPEGQFAMLLLEADDPWRPGVLAATEALERDLRAIPAVVPYSALDVFRRAHPDFRPDPAGAAAYREFATRTRLFRRQALVGDRFQGVAVSLAVKGPRERDAALAAVDAAVARLPPGAVREVRRVGAPYYESWVEQESNRAPRRTYPIFGAFVVGIALLLYRSVRSLLAVLIALAVSVALGVAAGGLLGFSRTIVSQLVPLTIMVTALANLVYIHSRFVDQPEGVDVDDHQAFALANKFLPVTASTCAACLGFAALSVSQIRPVREMGIWTAVGLGLSWVVAFTVFPALQKVLRTPTARARPLRTVLYDRVAGALPAFTWRARFVLVPAALLLALAGVLALTGVPGLLRPMKVEVDLLEYLDARLPIRRDAVFFREQGGGLNVARVWVQTPPGAVTDPEVLRGLDRLATALEAEPDVASVAGPTTFLRVRQILAGRGEELPQDPAAFARLAGGVEQLLLTEPELGAFLDARTLSNAQLTVVFRRSDVEGYRAISRAIEAAWQRTVAQDPAFRGARMSIVGESLLAAKVGASLVPTLSESFAITAGLIFLVFLLVFRSGTARLMAMIPSVFAILVTFLGMRLLGLPLNIATILIATTVLGTTENDQVHFFHHLQEGEGAGGFHGALRHTLHVSGRAIAFATLINAAGFLGLAWSNFPPLRQFGITTAAAFLLAMLADFTALPAALWMTRHEKPREAGERG